MVVGLAALVLFGFTAGMSCAQADWNSGIVTISKGKRKKVLDFRNERLTQVTSPQYFVVNLHDSEINDMTFQSLAQLAGDNNGAIRLGASAIFSFLKEPHEVLRDRLKRFMALSEQYNIPIVIQPSGEQYLNARPDLWNWWDPDKPGYDPDNRNNVEWIGWGPEYAIKIAWRNWGSQHRTLPPPNLMSPKYRAACDTELERVIPLILHWWEDLGESKTHLLIAVKMGWESSIGVNAFYYPDGNRLSDQPAAQDPHYGVNSQQLPARGMVTTGYAAATTIGLANSGKLTEAHQAEIVRRHLEAQCKKASMLGVPRDRLFTHVGGFKDEELLYDAAVNQYSCPGWSFYKHARNPARDQGVQRAWKSSDAPHWGAVEWYPHGAQGQEGWSAALNNSFSTPGIRYVCLFNWKSIHKNKEAQQAIQQLVTP